MRSVALLGGVLIMSGCAPVPPQPPAEVEPRVFGEGNCNAAPAQRLIGRAATTELGAEALRLTGATALRWIPPGSAVTMDYRTDRLNIELDAQNRVTRIRCG